jgi:hypothetical protein
MLRRRDSLAPPRHHGLWWSRNVGDVHDRCHDDDHRGYHHCPYGDHDQRGDDNPPTAHDDKHTHHDPGALTG